MKSFFLAIVICICLCSSNLLHAQYYYDTSIKNPFVDQNIFINKRSDAEPLPQYAAVKSKLPEPYWPVRQDVIACYWKAWELAFINVRGTTKENGFKMPYISPAFNNHLFMWDTSFMVMFGRYGKNAFNFQGSMDNFYARQHKDGYMCREIAEQNGAEIFEKYDPSSTGPNIMPWAEWDYYQYYKDKKRLEEVFPVLLAYYQWFQTNRSWMDGSYYSSGWGCGMDNQPRVQPGYHLEFTHAFMSWIDTNLQQIFAGKVLLKMAEVLNRKKDVQAIETEIKSLKDYVQQKMWDAKAGYFYDRFRDGSLSDVKSIASYWALLADVVPEKGRRDFIAHLANPNEFARLHRVPTISADTKGYSPDGNYWRGGVWAPTSYMVLRGLTVYKEDSLAHEIALNHLDNVVKVFTKTGTLWENYAPDLIEGKYRKDLVGWTGLVPISVLFEYVFGISADREQDIVVWDVRLLDEFGIKRYPLKNNGQAEFWCAKRNKNTDKPKIQIRSTIPLTVKLIWNGGMEIVKIKPAAYR